MSELTWRILVGDVREKLRELPDESVQCVVTSPPYWSLRDYGVPSSVWGGTVECDHDWSVKANRNGSHYTGKSRKKWQHIGHEAQAAGVKVRDVDPAAWGHPEIGDGAFCSLCGAWRGALGLEPTPELFVDHIVEVFRDVRRVLRKDGVCWFNIGDSYAAGGHGGGGSFMGMRGGDGSESSGAWAHRKDKTGWRSAPPGLKAKDLVMVPARCALALQADGWWVRSDVIWSKPNPMPESAPDRPAKAHEYIYLLTRSARYYWDADAVRTPYAASTLTQFDRPYEGKGIKDYSSAGVQNPSDIKRRITDKQRGHSRRHAGFNDRWDALPKDEQQMNGANCRTVWTVATQPYLEAHFATFPEEIPERCIMAASRVGDLVLDPFTGSGTTGAVAIRLGRSFVGVELNPAYVELAEKRIGSAAPLFAVESAGVSIAVDPHGDAARDTRDLFSDSAPQVIRGGGER